MTNYKELVKALRCIDIRLSCNECKYGRWSESGDAFGCDFENMVRDAADAIEALQAELTRISHELPHWVSVEERLPKIGQLILLYFGGCFSIAARTEDEMFEGKRYWKLEDGYWERIEDDYYWMPIEPPQEE